MAGRVGQIGESWRDWKELDRLDGMGYAGDGRREKKRQATEDRRQETEAEEELKRSTDRARAVRGRP